ncbi:EAL domain-containing protein [Synechococcus elongatus]|uniref:EAL domain-containing protein n=1 Tax=Synechococcus elongatus TaxID=32046 RepID=UPI000F7FA31F|nr:EAL domain-containing protein [Synechococcus elongatus]
MTYSEVHWRLLLVDDDEDDFIITRDLLRDAQQAQIQLDWCSDFQEALATMGRQEHDVYLVDYRLGAESGLDLIDQAIQAGVSRPIILLTGQGNEQLDASAIELGAADYLVKGQLDCQQLLRSIRYAIDRNLATTRLAESESHYRLLFEANPEPMWVFAKQGLQFLAVNQAASQFFGYSQQEFLAMTVLDIQSEEEKTRFLQFFESLVCNQITDPAVGVWAYRHKQGHQVFADVLIHDFEFDNQPCCLVLAIDITEKQAARELAHQREQAFRKLLNDNRDPLLVISGDRRICYANPAAQKLLKLNLEQLESQSLDLPLLSDKLTEWALTLPDGSVAEVEIHRSETDWEGQPADLLSFRDIAERKASEQQLRLLKESLEASFNGVVIVDAIEPDMPAIYVNPAFERITGYSEAEMLGRNCRILQGNERDSLQIEEIHRGLSQAKNVHVVIRNFRKDGQPFWNDLYISPIFNAQGNVTHFIGVQNDITEQKRYEEELSFSASHDVLTGLPNRAVLEDRLRQGCKMALRQKHSLAILFIDLDGFKLINDSIGHRSGDLLLVEVAQRMCEQVRAGDTVARIGGDEFIILLVDLKLENDVISIADRLLASVARPYHIQGIDLHVTASMGITLSDGDIEQPTQLIQQADLAMYKAKQEGRNNYQWYTNDLNLRLRERVHLRNELQKAIETEAFELYFQPKIEGCSGQVIGLEALLRWQHPQMGFISPATFVPIAEDTGQIIPLSQWVLETACRQLRDLLQQGIAAPSVAVNISTVQFRRINFVKSVQSALQKYQLKSEHLEIEITENVLFDNTEKAIEKLQRLKELGVNIAIDDFGTGFSSLSYLKELPIDTVKIDRSFVQEINTDSRDAAITQGIISMAHHLRLNVVAEGVETEQQFKFLQQSNCDQYQGYYFAKPMPFEALKQYLMDEAARELP